MKKQTRHKIELSLDLTNLNSRGRGHKATQSSNLEGQTQESQDSQPVCDEGVCEVDWRPSRYSIA